MLSESLRRGPSATTIALLYTAVVVAAALVVAAVLPSGRPRSSVGDYRLLPEYKKMWNEYEQKIAKCQRTVTEELDRRHAEARGTENDDLVQFWRDQQASLELEKHRWEPSVLVDDWMLLFSGVDFPEGLAATLHDYRRRHAIATARLKVGYETLTDDLKRKGNHPGAAILRAEAGDLRELLDFSVQSPSEQPLAVEQQPTEDPSAPMPPPVQPQTPPEAEPVVITPEPVPPPDPEPPMVVEVAGPPPPKKRFIDLNSFECREDDRRERLVEAFGGSPETEAAVLRALYWLAMQQGRDGLWSLTGPYPNGAADENRVAATAMALLAFQGAGNTTHKGMFRKAVDRAWKGLTQELDGRFKLQPPTKKHQLYAHALATIALCELVGMTKTDKQMVQEERINYAKRAQRALDFAVRAQGPNGGWRYEPGQAGDMSVTAWCLAAFKAAQMAGLQVRPDTLKKIDGFLDTVAFKDGSLYGYLKERPNAVATPVTVSTSAAGILCRQQRGWCRETPLLVAGIKELVEEQPFDWREGTDAYACYALTQVAHHMGGATWQEWNNHMKQVLPISQIKRRVEAGSWDPTHDRWGKEGGRLFVTCFCTYMLQVYYRYPPIYESRLDECGLP